MASVYMQNVFFCSRLSAAIKGGEVSFEGKTWEGISSDAKDMLSKLLEKDSKRRTDTR